MKTELKHYTVEEILKGFVYNELEGKGLFGLDGKLVIQPEYQRHYIYGDGKRDVAVIDHEDLDPVAAEIIARRPPANAMITAMENDA